jgi:hypothetical protein
LFALFVHDNAKADLKRLLKSEPKAAGRILALLEQLEADPDLLDRLTQHDYGAYGRADFHVSKWQEQWRKGRDLWRLKVWDLEDKGLRYRIVYAFIPGRKRYHVLAIVPRRGFNYEERDPVTQRIIRDYQDL